MKGVASHVQRRWENVTAQTVVGTTLFAIADTGTPFITLDGGVDGLQIFYPNQVVQASPTPCPWTTMKVHR